MAAVQRKVSAMKRLLVVLALIALATACGGNDDGGESADSGLKKAVTAYSDAFLTGDADTAHALMSKRCQARLPLDEFGTVVASAAQQYGDALDLDTFKASEDGDRATVTYTYADSPELGQTDEPWVREDGGWRTDDC